MRPLVRLDFAIVRGLIAAVGRLIIGGRLRIILMLILVGRRVGDRLVHHDRDGRGV
jgi:hypothetical protein